MEVDTLESITPAEFEERMKGAEVPVFDVRKTTEYASEHVKGAENTPLQTLNEHLAEFPENGDFYVHCAGGYRSVIAASILKSRGIHNLVDVQGGFNGIRGTAIEVTDYVCPSTL